MKLSDELIGKTVGTADEQDIQSFHRLSPSAVCSAAIPVCLILKGAYRKRKIMSKPLSRELYAAMPAIKGNTAPIVLYYRTIAENCQYFGQDFTDCHNRGSRAFCSVRHKRITEPFRTQADGGAVFLPVRTGKIRACPSCRSDKRRKQTGGLLAAFWQIFFRLCR